MVNCLNCDKTTYARGLCHTCYIAALRLIAGKKTSWKVLEGHGRALPTRSDSNKIKRWLMRK